MMGKPGLMSGFPAGLFMCRRTQQCFVLVPHLSCVCSPEVLNVLQPFPEGSVHQDPLTWSAKEPSSISKGENELNKAIKAGPNQSTGGLQVARGGFAQC